VGFSQLKSAPNSFSADSSVPDTAGGAFGAPQTLAGLRGTLLIRRREGMGGKERGHP